MIPFRLSFEPGISLYEQVVYAAKKAVISGQMRPGDPFPSVRALSKALKINPNTAHKVITQLVSDGLIEVLPGIGTVVAELPASTAAERGAPSRALADDAIPADPGDVPLGDLPSFPADPAARSLLTKQLGAWAAGGEPPYPHPSNAR